MGKGAGILIGGVGVVSSNPTGGNFFLKLFETLDVTFVQKCQICVENEKPARMLNVVHEVYS